jgi:hypothetical protein
MAELVSFGAHISCVASTDERRANMESALARGLPLATKLEPNGRALAIVGGGPSVADDLEELRNFKGDIWAVNGSLDWLASHGIKATGFVLIDPVHDMLARYLQGGHDCEYFIASFCAPETFDALSDKRVTLWHAGSGDVKPPKGQGMVGGGPTVMSRAPMLAFCVGYRDVHLFGADSSYEGDRHHVYEDAERENDVRVELDGLVYDTSPVFVHQVAYFQQIHHFFVTRDASFTIHGRGLGPAMMNARMHTMEEAVEKAEHEQKLAELAALHDDGIEGVTSREGRELRVAL